MLGHEVAAMLPDLQQQAESLMLDTAIVVRSPSGPSLNTTNGVLTSPIPETVHEGPCRLRQMSAQEQSAQFGEQHVTLSKFVACFPHDTNSIKIGDVVSLAATGDPDAEGRRYRVVAVPSATFTIYKAYPVEVVE